ARAGCAGRLRQGGRAGACVGNGDERVSTEKGGRGMPRLASKWLYAKTKTLRTKVRGVFFCAVESCGKNGVDVVTMRASRRIAFAPSHRSRRSRRSHRSHRQSAWRIVHPATCLPA
ncbi:hypothetical protein, partial [Burkholderia sp. MSMB1835]|uniref:hypothetical protein n=1 Tax=Burkholderia sp. MSMB1835 TaxID=1637876 RepID=UPI001C54E953